jgi:Flp pilus assembly pilin Flp
MQVARYAQRTARRWLRDSRGATMAEYSILLILIIVAAAATFKTLGTTAGNKAIDSGNALDTIIKPAKK